jgi:hypothetical protein
MIAEILCLCVGAVAGYQIHHLSTSDIFLWLNYLLLPVVNAAIRVEHRLVSLLDMVYANSEVRAYAISSQSSRPDGSWLYDVSYVPTSFAYRVPILGDNDLESLTTQMERIEEPTYRWLRRSKPSSLNLAADHRQIICATAYYNGGSRDVPIELIYKFAGPRGDFFAHLPGDQARRCEMIRQCLADELNISTINTIECVLTSGEVLMI